MPIRVQQRTDIPATGGPSGAGPLPVPLIEQEQTQWCWAACAEMVLRYLGNGGVAQCDFANFLFGESSCCTTPDSSTCNSPCEIDDVSLVYGNWRIQSSLAGTALTFDVLEQEVAALRPVEVGYIWNGGGGHLALVVQTATSDGQPLVVVNDPKFGSHIVQYSELLAAYGLGIWALSWTGIGS